MEKHSSYQSGVLQPKFGSTETERLRKKVAWLFLGLLLPEFVVFVRRTFASQAVGTPIKIFDQGSVFAVRHGSFNDLGDAQNPA